MRGQKKKNVIKECGDVLNALQAYLELVGAGKKNGKYEPFSEKVNQYVRAVEKVESTKRKPLLMLTANELSKLKSDKMGTLQLRMLGEYFECPNRSEVLIPRFTLSFSKSPEHPENSEQIVENVRNVLDQLIVARGPDDSEGVVAKMKPHSQQHAKRILEFLYDLAQDTKPESIDTLIRTDLEELRKTGSVLQLKAVIEDACSKLKEVEHCDLARRLANRSSEHFVDKIDRAKALVDLDESKNFERSRSNIVNLRWPRPYRDQWLYVESSIHELKEHKGKFATYFVKSTEDTEGSAEGNAASKGEVSTVVPPSADNFAFLYDPFHSAYLDEFEINCKEELIEWKMPKRFYDPMYLSIVRAIRRKELLEDKELIGIEAGLTEFNKTIRLRRCRFTAVVGSHYIAGVSIFDKSGDRKFHGMRHVALDQQWLLLRTQNCPNALRISTLVVTEDGTLFVVFGQANSFFTQKSWQPLVTGFITMDDFMQASIGKQSIKISDLSRQTIQRKLMNGYGITPDQIEPTEIVGIAMDVLHGRIPTIFSITRLKMSRAELSQRLADRGVFRQLDLITDYPQASYLELLESSAYQDAELLRANLFFALKRESRKSADPSHQKSILRNS